MQILTMYTIFDHKGGRFDTPFFAYNDVMAERRFVMGLKDKNTVMGNFPTHFSLVKLGEFDVLTGNFMPYSEPFGDRCILEGGQVDLGGDK